MANPSMLRYIHQKVLEFRDRELRGILEPDKPMFAISAISQDKTYVGVLVNETKNGLHWAAFFKSTGPGAVEYAPDELREESRGDDAFIARAKEFAATHTMLPAVQRKYPKSEEKPK